jgi:uncharacterized protein YdeI (YjbR/CyaY-like superfamily)
VTGDGLARVEVRSQAELRAWLAANHAQAESIWLVTWKKGHAAHLPYGAIVDEALCFGWVDSRPRRLDDARTMVLLSPRRAGSAWSGVNKARVARLLNEGHVAPPGLAAIDRAKADGTWTVLDGASALAVPEDLAAALDAAGARASFDAFPPSARRAILEWITLAKRSETRAARVAETARAAARGERANAWRKTARAE